MRLGRLNRLQRFGLIAMGAALVLLLAIHNPTAGYTTYYYRYDLWPLPIPASASPEVVDRACAPPGRDQKDTLAAQKKYLGQELARCRMVQLSVMDWRSNGAFEPRAAAIWQVLTLAGAILLGGLTWLWLFHDPPTGSMAPGQRSDAVKDQS